MLIKWVAIMYNITDINMKNILGLIFVLSWAISSNAQTKLTSRDSVNVFYDSLFNTLKSDYLYKNEVEWTLIENETRASLNQFSDFKSSMAQTTILFDKIKATHCQIYYNDTVFTATYNGPTEKDFSEQWINKYITEPNFEVEVLENKYGYILIPAINFEDISLENIHNVSQPLYDEINKIKSSNSLKGWIIDLRFNSGGNIYPMLLALYDFLGDNAVYGTMDIDKKIISMTKLKNGKYIDDDSITSYIIPKGKKLIKTKVALITGIVTASSGEITAIAFKGRENTILIGEKTMGMTTTNVERYLPFGAVLALTIGYDCDRNGNFYESIIPDIVIKQQDNFDNLLLDKNIKEAINWINKK